MDAASSSPPAQVRNSEELSQAIGIDVQTLTFAAYGLKDRYRHFEILKRSGSKRTLHAPKGILKVVQRKVLDFLYQYQNFSSGAHGFVPGRSIVSGAERHTRQKWVLRVDLVDFFGTVTFNRTRGVFLARPFFFSSPLAQLLARLVTHNNSLPQGAPTSPLITNLVCRTLDRKLKFLARKYRCYYSRYADDISFSTSSTSFPSDLASRESRFEVNIGPALESIIVDEGFRVAHKKTRLAKYTERQLVTGLVVNRSVNIPRDYVRSLRSLLYIWQKYGEADAYECLRIASKGRLENRRTTNLTSIVAGRIQYVGSVKGWSSPVYLRLASKLKQIVPEFHIHPLVPDAEPRGELVVYTEGPTDVLLLRAAARSLRAQGRFKNLIIHFSNPAQGIGEGALGKMLESFAKQPHSKPTLFLFDRDSKEILNNRTDPNDKFGVKSWGNSVYSCTIIPPETAPDPDRVCIELLFPDQIRHAQNSKGRRLFLTEEFEKTSGVHRDMSGLVLQNPKTKSLIADHVVNAMERKKVALSKRDFATEVYSQQRASDFDYRTFLATFGAFGHALHLHASEIRSRIL